MKSSPAVKHSVSIDGRQTTISLEEAFWTALKEIAKKRGESVQHLITSIDADRRSANLSSVIRLFVLQHYKDQFARQGEMQQYLHSSPSIGSGADIEG